MKKDGKLMLYVLFLIGVIFSGIIIYSQTDIFFSTPGQTTKRYISVDGSDFYNEGAVLVKLVRNSQTPSTYDIASFEDGEKFSYALVENDEINNKKVFFNIPLDYLEGNYYVDYEIIGDKQTIKKTIKISVS